MERLRLEYRRGGGTKVEIIHPAVWTVGLTLSRQQQASASNFQSNSNLFLLLLPPPISIYLFVGSLPNPPNISSRPTDKNKPSAHTHTPKQLFVSLCARVTCQRMIWVCGWECMFAVGSPACPLKLAGYLRIWHRKKGEHPVAKDYSDLDTNTHHHAPTHAHADTRRDSIFGTYSAYWEIQSHTLALLLRKSVSC